MQRSTHGGNTPVHICMVNDNYYRSSGVAITVRRITDLLPDVRFSFAGAGNEGLPEDLSWMPEGSYHRFDLKTGNLLRVARELIRFRAWYRSRGCDLVHCHHRRMAAVLRFTGLPVLYTGHLAFPRELWFYLLAPRWLTAVTPSVARNLQEGTGKKVLACISNPLSFPEHPPFVDNAELQNRAICIGRLDAVKGHTHLLEAWKILADRGLVYALDIVGEGPLRESLEAQARSAGILEHVHFHGFVRDVRPLVLQCRFAVLLSEVEGQGIVTLEAAALGRPSLLTAVPGSVDLLPVHRKLVNGLAYGDAVQAADALQQWFGSPEAVITEGRSFFEALKDSCRPDRVADEYRAVYRQLCG